MNSLAAYPTLFAAASSSARAVQIDAAAVVHLQAFFDANPEYFLIVDGAPPAPDVAQQEFDDRPPAGWVYSAVRLIGWIDADGELLAMAQAIADLIAPTVWHIGLFIVATRLHGSGVANMFYRALEDWCRGQGARWIRLGVVSGSTRAEHFWAKCGYVELRLREGVPMGQRVNTVRVMVKPLTSADVAPYLELIEHDRPGAA